MSKRDDDAEIGEIEKLNNGLNSFASIASVSGLSVAASSCTDSGIDRNPFHTQVLVRQFTAALILSIVGWYGPRYFIYNEDTIEKKVVPFHVTAAGDVILDGTLNNPLVDPSTIPSRLLIMTSIWIPLFLIALTPWLSRWTGDIPVIRNDKMLIWQMQARFGGFLTTLGLSEGITLMLKLMIQRRRPNFYALCGWSMEQRACTAPLNKIREANFSFPSGHSSLTCCAMTYLIWLFLGILVAAWNRPSTKGNTKNTAAEDENKSRRCISRLEVFQCSAVFIIIVPLGWALFVAATRVIDYWHHPSDVVAGLVLGFTMGTVGYHVWFPPLVYGRSLSSRGSFGPAHPWSIHLLVAPSSSPTGIISQAGIEIPSRLSSFHD